MNNLKLAVIIVSILFTVMACNNSTDNNSTLEVEKTFFASKIDGSNETYTLNADLLAFSDHAAVYVEEGSTVSSATAQNIVNTFENSIYENIRTYFAYESDVDNNGRIILLLLDIVDGYSGSGGYVAGYFDPYHIFDAFESNKADMIYLDIDPLDPGSEEFIDTIAHEFQHLVNFAEHYLRGGGSSQDLWINEGLSSAAEYLYNGIHKQSRINYYNADTESTISEGNNFFVWNGSENDVLTDYATVYVFFQWMRIHASNGAGIYKDIMNSSYMDYRSVEESIEARVYENSVDWFNIIRDWYLAIGGFSTTNNLYTFEEFSLNFHFTDNTSAKINLLPGEGIFDSITDSFTNGSPPTNIGYVGINTDTEVLDFLGNDGYSGHRLLAWNGSSEKEDPSIETPISTSSVVMSSIEPSLSMSTASNSLPKSYPIGVSFPNPGSGKIKRDD